MLARLMVLRLVEDYLDLPAFAPVGWLLVEL
jgi:hypothetical protein